MGRKKRVNKHLEKIRKYRKTTRKKRFYMVCKQCKKTEMIRTSNPELYTKELRDSWLCLKCKRK
jgi:hypothetical protein